MDSSPSPHHEQSPKYQDDLPTAKDEDESLLLEHRSIPGLGTILQCGKTVLGDSYLPKLSASPVLDTTKYIGQINRMFNDSPQTFEKSQMGQTLPMNNCPRESTQIIPQADPIVKKSANFSIFHDPYGLKTNEPHISQGTKRVLIESDANNHTDNSSMSSARSVPNLEVSRKIESVVDHTSIDFVQSIDTMSVDVTITPPKINDHTKPMDPEAFGADRIEQPTASVETPDLNDPSLFERLNQPRILRGSVTTEHGNLSMLNSPTTLLTGMLDLISKDPRYRNKYM